MEEHIKMLKEIRSWQINQCDIYKTFVYGDNHLHNELLILLGRFPDRVAIDDTFQSIFECLSEREITDELKRTMPIQHLAPFIDDDNLVDHDITIEIYSQEGSSVKRKVKADRLICSKAYRRMLYTKDSEKNNGRLSFPLNIEYKDNIANSLVDLLNGRYNSYYFHLQTIKEFYYFVQIFKMLDLSIIDLSNL